MGCVECKPNSRFLSGENLEFLKSYTRYDEATIEEFHKSFMKDCPAGQLTCDKFIDLYKMFIWVGNAEQYCEHVFKTFDTDQNGVIDFEEFLLAMYVKSARTAGEKLTWAFRMYDLDGNGVIDPEEMLKVVQAIYSMPCKDATEPMSVADERSRKIFRRMDVKRDGLLTEKEFFRRCLKDDELSKLCTMSFYLTFVAHFRLSGFGILNENYSLSVIDGWCFLMTITI